MKIFLSIFIGYLLSGISQVVRDIGANPIDKPGWAREPALTKAILIAATWPVRPFAERLLGQNKKLEKSPFVLSG